MARIKSQGRDVFSLPPPTLPHFATPAHPIILIIVITCPSIQPFFFFAPLFISCISSAIIDPHRLFLFLFKLARTDSCGAFSFHFELRSLGDSHSISVPPLFSITFAYRTRIKPEIWRDGRNALAYDRSPKPFCHAQKAVCVCVCR